MEPHVDFRIVVDQVFELLNGWVKEVNIRVIFPIVDFGFKPLLERISVRRNPTTLFETITPLVKSVGHVGLVDVTLVGARDDEDTIRLTIVDVTVQRSAHVHVQYTFRMRDETSSIDAFICSRQNRV